MTRSRHKQSRQQPRMSGPARTKLLELAQQAEEMLALRRDPKPWIEANLQIRDKRRRVIPFVFNWAQQEFYEHKTGRDIIVKPRQMGFTTQIDSLFFADCLLRPNTTSVIVAHDQDSSERIFRIVKFFWDHLPAKERQRVGPTSYSSRRELAWPKIGSTFFVRTAGSERAGHGLTINNLHCSEVSRWTHPEEVLVSLLEAVPKDGRVVLESTPNGMGNYFHTLWTEAKQGRNGFAPHFYVWWEDPEYCICGPPFTDLTLEEKELKARWELDDDQIRWRRAKIAELPRRMEDFREQYPEDDVTCFLTSGRCCFDTTALLAMQQRIAPEPAPETVPILNWTTKDAIGRTHEQQIAVTPATLRIWKPPKENCRYVIGADVGEGLPEGDASAAVVLERVSGEQVAELHGRVPPERFGQLLNALGRYYNLATVAVERNNHGHSTLNTLRNTCRYRRLYYHVRYDITTKGGASPMLGWPTDQATKPILVDDLAAAISESAIVIHSPELIDECFSFVTDRRGSQSAQEGAFDDRVIALGIAWQVRKQGESRALKERPPGW